MCGNINNDEKYARLPPSSFADGRAAPTDINIEQYL